MVKEKKILNCCPNYNEIVNCDFLEDDLFTKKLIEYYQEFIFNIDENNDEQKNRVKKLDEAIYKYIADYRFAKTLKNTLDIDVIINNGFSYLEQLMEYIVSFFSEYQEQEIRDICQTRWI